MTHMSFPRYIGEILLKMVPGKLFFINLPEEEESRVL